MSAFAQLEHGRGRSDHPGVQPTARVHLQTSSTPRPSEPRSHVSDWIPMNVLFRSIITGFGLRIGAEIAKRVSKRMFREDEGDSPESEGEEGRAAGSDDDDLPGVTPDPPEV